MNRYIIPIAIAIGCSCLTAPQKRAALILDCRVRLLEPYVGALTPELVRETIVNGPKELVLVLVRLGTDLEEVRRVGDAWDACAPATVPSTPAPAVTPRRWSLPLTVPPGAAPSERAQG